MRTAAVALCIVSASFGLGAQTPPWPPSPGHAQVPIWPSTVAAGRAEPDGETTSVVESMVAGRPWLQVRNVSRPTLTVYSPKGTSAGAAVIVFPGGGYQILAIDLEGTEVCDWLTTKGITCVLLKYRVPNAGPTWDQQRGCDVDTRSSRPLEDAQRTISLVRSRAAEWHVDPHKIGVLGFSAGGHLAAAAHEFARFAAHLIRLFAKRASQQAHQCAPSLERLAHLVHGLRIGEFRVG